MTQSELSLLASSFLARCEANNPGGEGFYDSSFPPQHKFVIDPARFIVAQCSRRAGKSNGLALRFLNTLATHPGCFCPYIALTRESARNIMWPVLEEQDQTFKIGLTFTESNLTVTHPNGARLQLFGADMKNFIRRLKGIKTPGAAIDEAQDFGAHLQSLVDDVLTPTLADYEDSWLAITGTPGPVPHGYFFDITEKRKFGFSLHKWTINDNPYLPNSQNFIAELKLKRGWDELNATLQREWYNNWVLDEEALLIRYRAQRNSFTDLPQAPMVYTLGIDIGLRDSDALCVLGWVESSHDIYLVEEVITAGQDLTELERQITTLLKRYDISKIVMDTGGLGLKIAEEFIRRKQIPIQAADKTRKFENVAFLNEWLALGRFKAKESSRFAEDSYKVQIDYERTTPDRLVVRTNYHSDIIDAVLYAFKESPAYAYKTPRAAPAYGTKEWADLESEKMEEQAIEYFEREQSIEALATNPFNDPL